MIPMLQTVLQNLFGAPATRPFPAARREPFDNARGTIGFDMEKCNLCGLCAMRCPANALHVSKADKELVFEPFNCVMCAACAEACNKGCAHVINVRPSPAGQKPRQVHKKPEAPPAAPHPDMASAAPAAPAEAKSGSAVKS